MRCLNIYYLIVAVFFTACTSAIFVEMSKTDVDLNLTSHSSFSINLFVFQPWNCQKESADGNCCTFSELLLRFVEFKPLSGPLRAHPSNFCRRDMILISAAPEHYFSNTAPQYVDSLTPPLHSQVNIKQSIGHGRGVDM